MLGKVSCLYSDVREQDSPGGNTDDRTVLTPLNPNAVAFPNSVVCVKKPSGFFLFCFGGVCGMWIHSSASDC